MDTTDVQSFAGVQSVTDATFEQAVLGATGPVLVDFWADWCTPCKHLAPVLEQVASELQGQVAVAKINVDENPQAARRFNIRSLPTLIVFVGGLVVEERVGTVPKKTLLETLSAYVR